MPHGTSSPVATVCASGARPVRVRGRPTPRALDRPGRDRRCRRSRARCRRRRRGAAGRDHDQAREGRDSPRCSVPCLVPSVQSASARADPAKARVEGCRPSRRSCGSTTRPRRPPSSTSRSSPDARITHVQRNPEGGPGVPGAALVVGLELQGQQLSFLNGGPSQQLSEAFSLVVNCEGQQEVDRLLGRAARRWRIAACVRLAQGPVRALLAGGARRAAATDGRPRPGQGRCRRRGDAADGQDRRGRVASGVRRGLTPPRDPRPRRRRRLAVVLRMSVPEADWIAELEPAPAGVEYVEWDLTGPAPRPDIDVVVPELPGRPGTARAADRALAAAARADPDGGLRGRPALPAGRRRAGQRGRRPRRLDGRAGRRPRDRCAARHPGSRPQPGRRGVAADLRHLAGRPEGPAHRLRRGRPGRRAPAGRLRGPGDRRGVARPRGSGRHRRRSGPRRRRAGRRWCRTTTS